MPGDIMLFIVGFMCSETHVEYIWNHGLGSVLGYLLAGIVIAPVLKWFHADVLALQHFTEFGVVMMLFLIGLEMQPKVLWAMQARIFLMGGLQVLITTLAVMGVTMLLGQSWSIALAVGLTLALSSTAIVTQTLNEKSLMKSDGGQAAFSVLLFQDIAVIPMLTLLPLLALPNLKNESYGKDAHSSSAGEAALNLNMVEGLSTWQSTLSTVAVIGFVILAGKYLTGPIFRYVARAKLRELFVSTALMLVLGIALLMTVAGLSPALGTFLAGVVMANSEYRHELESNIAPFKGMFLGIFFITVGASIDFALLSNHLVLIVALTVGLIALKLAVMLILARVFKLGSGDQWLVALSLAQAGEFGFVLVSFTVANAVIPNSIASLVLLVVALSMLLTPVLFILYEKFIAPRFSSQQTQEADDISSDSGIIIAGHGRFGGIVNRALQAAGHSTTVVDFSNEHIQTLRRLGFRAYYGDATRPDLLHAAGIENAKLFVIAIDNKEAITNLARHIIKHHPHVHIVARAVDRMHVYDLWKAGCRDIIRETYDSSIRATRSVLEALGEERSKAEKITAVFEAHDHRTMLELATAYDGNDPFSENNPYYRHIKENRSKWESRLQNEMNAVLNN